MIFLDAQTFIEEAIESVFAQTYNNWELLLVDDGSSDGSTTIAQRYAQQFNEKVRYLEHPGHKNRGMSASRNVGIRAAQGELIAFLDADDIYLPEKLERQVQILTEHPDVAMVYGPSEHWYSWTGKVADADRDALRKIGVSPNTVIEPPILPRLFLENKAQTPGTCSVLVRRSITEHIGGFEERFRGMFEDQIFFYKILLNSPVYVTNACYDRYRQHSMSHSRIMDKLGEYNRRSKPNPSHHAFLIWLDGYIRSQHITDPILIHALRKQLWPYCHPILYRLMELPIYNITRLFAISRTIARTIR
jgi:glycosyltransferase involved in cell wall biosynthesis